jgi:coenzyme F420-reducing hydrogenase gamma subunit
MDVKIFQFNGCNKCFNETILLKGDSSFNVDFIEDPKNWKEQKTDVSVITGYLLPEDKQVLDKIKENSTRIFAYGDCTTTGGVFALSNQRGHEVKPLQDLIKDVININECLGEIEELQSEIKGEELPKLKNLCIVC